MYMAMRIQFEMQTNFMPVRCDNEREGVVGVIPVFRTKTAARKWYGRNVELREIEIPEPV